VADRLLVPPARHAHQAEHRRRQPGLAQRERLLDPDHPEPPGAGGQCRLGDRDHAVAIRVRLDDGHEFGRSDVLAQPRDIVTDHAEIDLCFRRNVHDLTVCQSKRSPG